MEFLKQKNGFFKKIFFYFLCGAIVCGGIGFWYFLPKAYHESIDVRFRVRNTPLLPVLIGNQHYWLEMDLGSKFALSLDKSVLDRILNKKEKGKCVWKDFSGKEYSSSSYEIQEIKIANISFQDALASENADSFKKNTTFWKDAKDASYTGGTIGRPILSQFNLLLDFSHARLYVSNDLKRLQQEGFDLDKFVKIPFEMNRAGIVIMADTDNGPKKFAIDSGASFTILRKNEQLMAKSSQEKHGYHFVKNNRTDIGGVDFGSLNITLLDITSEVHEIDGILGMDFLKKHCMYIDFKNKQIYLNLKTTVTSLEQHKCNKS